jgi:2-polyprenyl-6-methoxyphenol hydroxylase-like FAD-dependent oxidoreductase
MIQTLHTPVLIVGAGPVGLALAADLAWRGVPCLLVEKSDGSIYQPKMDLVGIRTMEFCRRWGITEWVEQSPYPRDYPQDNIYVTSLHGYELGREPLPTLEQTRAPYQSPAHRERCPQDLFDPILRRFAESFIETDLRYHHELLRFSEEDDGVRAIVRSSAGTEITVMADYLVGCDGAASTVRSGLGISMSGRGVLTYTTNIVFRCADLASLHDKAPGYRFIFIGDEGTWATMVAINGHDRWRFSLIGNDKPRKWSMEEISDALERAVGIPFEYEIESVVPWVRRELVADSYGTGRVFLAGDSAHLTSPTGGLGMNTGIADAVDLSWKLDAVLAGWGGPELLGAYEIERRPAALRITQESTENLAAMQSPKEYVTADILDPGPAGELHRQKVGEKFTEAMRREWFSMGLHLGHRYDASPVILNPDPLPPPPTNIGQYLQTAQPGGRAPHFWVEPNRSSLDLFGRGFVLLRIGTDAPPGRSIIETATSLGVPLRVAALDGPEARELYERSLVLIRPDGYVAWWSDTEPQDPHELLRIICGQGSIKRTNSSELAVTQ